MRASDADREQVVGVLKDAFVHGRLTRNELDARAGQAFASRTYAELAALTADIPAAPVAARPPTAGSVQRRARSPQHKGYRAAAGLFMALSVCLLAGIEIADPDGNPIGVLIVWALFTAFCALVIGGLLLLHARLDAHAAGPLPPGQGPGTPGLKGQQPGQLGAAPETCLDQTSTDPRTQASRLGQLPRRSARAPLGMQPVPGPA